MCNSFEEYLVNISNKKNTLTDMLSNTKCPDCEDINWESKYDTDNKLILICKTCQYKLPLGTNGTESPLLRKFLEDPTQFKTSPGEMIERISKNEKEKANLNLPKCPRCGSTSITAGQRGYSILTGFLGSGSTVNRCANCGYKWKPHKEYLS